MNNNLSNSVRLFRITGILEGISLLVLFGIAMPLKYMAGKPEMVKYTGWIHGILFVVYMALAMWFFLQKSWPYKRVLLAFLAALLPFGTFLFDSWLQKQEKNPGTLRN